MCEKRRCSRDEMKDAAVALTRYIAFEQTE
jgi:hypothetical protein